MPRRRWGRRRHPLDDPEPLIRRVYAYTAYRIGPGPDAEDVTSEVFERALRYEHTYDESKGEFVGWLLGIARRCVDQHLSAPRTVPLEPVGRRVRVASGPGDGGRRACRPRGGDGRARGARSRARLALLRRPERRPDRRAPRGAQEHDRRRAPSRSGASPHDPRPRGGGRDATHVTRSKTGGVRRPGLRRYTYQAPGIEGGRDI